MNILRWFRVRRQAAKDNLRRCGFDYAAGELLRGKSVEEVESWAYDRWHQDEFNYGMQSAILAWDRMNYEKSRK